MRTTCLVKEGSRVKTASWGGGDSGMKEDGDVQVESKRAGACLQKSHRGVLRGGKWEGQGKGVREHLCLAVRCLCCSEMGNARRGAVCDPGGWRSGGESGGNVQ